MKTLCTLSLLLTAAPAALADNGIDWTPDATASTTAHIEAGDYQTVTSVLILKDGKPVYEHYFRDTDAATLHDTRSATKTLVGMAVGAAIHRGRLPAATAKAAAYFPEYKAVFQAEPRKAAITVEDLLTMSGPLECDDWNEFSRGNEERMYLVEDWTGFYWSLPLRGFPAWQQTPDKAPYGRAYSYCTAGVQLLGNLIGRATGQAFTDFVEKAVFEPAGVTDFKWQYNGRGEAHMGGGLLLTTRSLGQLGELERQRGTVAGRTVFSADWADRSIAPQAAVPQDRWLYGYLWWLQSFAVGGQSYRAAAMNGNGGNRVWVLPDFGLTIVLTKTDYGTRGMHQAAQAFFDKEILPRLTVDSPAR